MIGHDRAQMDDEYLIKPWDVICPSDTAFFLKQAKSDFRFTFKLDFIIINKLNRIKSNQNLIELSVNNSYVFNL